MGSLTYPASFQVPVTIQQDAASDRALTIFGQQNTSDSDAFKIFDSSGNPVLWLNSRATGGGPGIVGKSQYYDTTNVVNAPFKISPALAQVLEFAAIGGAVDAHFGRIQTGMVGSADSDLVLATVGFTIRIKEGVNAKMGRSVLVAGAVTVANTSVTNGSEIFVTSQIDGGTPGFLRVSARTAGTSFVITSSNAADTSTVAWVIFQPSP